MSKEKCVLVFTENTNNDDRKIIKMIDAIKASAKKIGVDFSVIGGNISYALLIEQNSFNDIYEIADDVQSAVSCDFVVLNFQDELSVYRNFYDAVLVAGSDLTFNILTALDYDVESLDFKAIACRDYSRFYGDSHG